MNVTVEFADDQHPARLVAREVMEELRRRVRALVDRIGVREPAIVTDQLVMLVDGLSRVRRCSARMGRSSCSSRRPTR